MLNNGIVHSHTQQETDQLRLCRFAANVSTVGLFTHCVETQMECHWGLRSKNADDIKALMYPQ